LLAVDELLHLLGTTGLRRAEAGALLIADVDEHPRSEDARLRRAIAHSTPWWVTVRKRKRKRKRGRRRRVPLEQAALDALRLAAG
jgi:integrase